MKRNFLKLHITILTFTILFITKSSFPTFSEKVLITDHFKIDYNIKISGFAASIAVKSESINDIITSFLEIENPSRITISISDNDQRNFFIKRYSNTGNKLFISSGCNYSLVEKKLYREIFELYLETLFQDSKSDRIIGKNFIDAVIEYPANDHDHIAMKINDLVNASQINAVDLKRIDEYESDDQIGIYTAFIDFIISKYGKNIFIQSLKDTAYYGDFFISLSSITGTTLKEVSDGFNTYLGKHKSAETAVNGNNRQLFHKIDDFNDISFSLISDEAAVLQKNGNMFRMLLKTGDLVKYIRLARTDNESYFSDLVFVDNKKIALVEILQAGSAIRIFDIGSGEFIDYKFLPALFISSINKIEGGEDSAGFINKVIFSAISGSESDIFSFELNSGNLEILTESGVNYFPVYYRDKIYSISNTGKGSIIESDIRTGTTRTLFSAEKNISGLNIVDGKTLFFSTWTNGSENIFSFDITSGMLRQITLTAGSNFRPLILNKKMYYLSFHKNCYRLFYDSFNTPDI